MHVSILPCLILVIVLELGLDYACFNILVSLYLISHICSTHFINLHYYAVKFFLYNTHAVNMFWKRKGIFCLWYKIRLNQKPNRKNRLTEISVSWFLVLNSVSTIANRIHWKTEQHKPNFRFLLNAQAYSEGSTTHQGALGGSGVSRWVVPTSVASGTASLL